jgi:hypothetical protein
MQKVPRAELSWYLRRLYCQSQAMFIKTQGEIGFIQGEAGRKFAFLQSNYKLFITNLSGTVDKSLFSMSNMPFLSYQEQILSRRQIIIVECRIFSLCLKAKWKEDLVMENVAHTDWSDFDKLQNLFLCPLHAGPNKIWNRYRGTVQILRLGIYCRGFDLHGGHIECSLRYKQDLGEQAALSILFGHLVAMFDLTLFWVIIKSKRRLGFPSWSWAGWFGIAANWYIPTTLPQNGFRNRKTFFATIPGLTGTIMAQRRHNLF